MKTVLPFLFLASFVAADNDKAAEFDLNSGVRTQQETEAVVANQLTYTTGGGVPFVHSVLVNMAISNRLSQCTGCPFCSAGRIRGAPPTARFSFGWFLF